MHNSLVRGGGVRIGSMAVAVGALAGGLWEGRMKETEAKPALRISHIVYWRRSEGRRVTYLVDPRGEATSAIAEEVALALAGAGGDSRLRLGGARLSLDRAAAHCQSCSARTSSAGSRSICEIRRPARAGTAKPRALQSRSDRGIRCT